MALLANSELLRHFFFPQSGEMLSFSCTVFSKFCLLFWIGASPQRELNLASSLELTANRTVKMPIMIFPFDSPIFPSFYGREGRCIVEMSFEMGKFLTHCVRLFSLLFYTVWLTEAGNLQGLSVPLMLVGRNSLESFCVSWCTVAVIRLQVQIKNSRSQ